eukprot:366134-Chlamydomonas_euryale.AAC.13
MSRRAAPRSCPHGASAFGAASAAKVLLLLPLKHTCVKRVTKAWLACQHMHARTHTWIHTGNS